MSTLLGSKNANTIGQQARPSHPVDAALWGLAERLAGGPEPQPSEAVDPSTVIDVDSVDHRSSHVRVVRLPQRAGGLPSVGRMGRRNPAIATQTVGVPTKPAAAVTAKT